MSTTYPMTPSLSVGITDVEDIGSRLRGATPRLTAALRAVAHRTTTAWRSVDRFFAAASLRPATGYALPPATHEILFRLR